MTADDAALDPLEARLRAILPEEYRTSYDEVQPVSMGSAGLRFGADGKVAWNEMWATFCDLAMAGGPPHKGMLLEPAPRADVEAQPEAYAAVVAEICRGVSLVSGLAGRPAPTPGWVRLTCGTETMAAWLLRAIVMENVSACADGRVLDLPASPTYRVEKEIKNVVTVVAKTCHYWSGHMRPVQQRIIGQVFDTMNRESPLIVPAPSGGEGGADDDAAAFAGLSGALARGTGFAIASHRYGGWLGITCPSVRVAVWMMRMVVAGNVLARRERTVLFVPVNPAQDPGGRRVAAIVETVHRLAVVRGVA